MNLFNKVSLKVKSLQKPRRSLIPILLSMLNLVFMHYYFYFSGYIEWIWAYSAIINICSVVFDVSVLLVLFLLLLGGRFRLALLITFILTFIWAIVNVEYGKFFYQYISLSAIGEAHALGDGLVINSMMAGFHWYDLFFIASLACFVMIYRKIPKYIVGKKLVLKLLGASVVSLLMTILTYSAFHLIQPKYRNNWELYQFRLKEFLYDPVQGGTPNLAHFQNGSLRVCAYEIYDMLHRTELSDDQMKEISAFYLNHSLRETYHQHSMKHPNVIFILLESFLSAPIDLIIDGTEIMPFLNELKRDSDVYYNGNMISDIGCGESGDGQFIYMNGILPLHSKMTVGQVKDHTLPSLPRILAEYCDVKRSEIIFPTMPKIWQQADMNKVYGFTEAYSMEDIVGGSNKSIDDEMIFKFAANRLDSVKNPFFSLILSVSTHSPYNIFVGEDLRLSDKTLSKEYKNYLNTCHYLDRQLCRYFNKLKAKGLYENSLIVLCADHHAHSNRLNMNNRISSHTPLFIVHGNINKSEVWNSEFHQLDVYTTVLDILGANSKWKGLGHTLLMPTYRSPVNNESIRLSEMIIEGDFFKD